MGLDPYAWLTDFIADPVPGEIAFARRMALRLSSRIPDLETASEYQDLLCEALAAVMELTERGRSLADIHDAQQRARGLLKVIRDRGMQ